VLTNEELKDRALKGNLSAAVRFREMPTLGTQTTGETGQGK